MADPPSGGALGRSSPGRGGGGRDRGRGGGGESCLRTPPRPLSPRRASASLPPGNPQERPARSRPVGSRGRRGMAVSLRGVCLGKHSSLWGGEGSDAPAEGRPSSEVPGEPKAARRSERRRSHEGSTRDSYSRRRSRRDPRKGIVSGRVH
ncbi:hypothetical protein MC885_003601, partial [Smutsia gigantea]